MAFTKFFIRPDVKGWKQDFVGSSELGAGYSSLKLPSASSLIPLLGRPAQLHVRNMYVVYPCCSHTKRATTFKSPGSSTALHQKIMQTTLDDVCMIVFCSAVQNYIIFGLFRMLLQSYLINLLGLTWKMSFMKYL